MIQGGDPTGTGRGGESVYDGRPFKDEFHSRLRFIHRGILAMANEGKPNTNGSQFFITLGECPWLQKKHTIFGKVVGDSIYNVAEMGKLETAGAECEDGDRPLEPPVIKSIDVDWNPFDDIVPRARASERADAEADAAGEGRRKRRRKAEKNLGLLSFGDDELQMEEEMEEKHGAGGSKKKTGGMKSSHDLLLDDSRLSSKLAVDVDAVRNDAEARRRGGDAGDGERTTSYAPNEGPQHVGDEEPEGDFDQRMRDSVLQKRMASQRAGQSETVRHCADENESDGVGADKGGLGKAATTSSSSKLAFVKSAFNPSVGDRNIMTSDQQKREEIKHRKRHTQEREKGTLAKLLAFKSKLASGKTQGSMATVKDGRAGAEQSGKEDYKLSFPAAWRVNDYIDGADDGDDIGDWKRHKLEFKQEKRSVDPMARSEDVDDYVVVDPLLERGKAKFNAASHRKRQEREWNR